MRLRVVQFAPWIALMLSVAVVELGMRAPAAEGVAFSLPFAASGWVDRMRAAPYEALHNPAASALVIGVVLGRTDGIDAGVQAVFLDSGLWHVLAASGQNVGLVAMLCIGAARLLRAPRVSGVLFACAAIAGYVSVVGSGASIVRAGLLACLLLAGWTLGCSADARHVLVVSAAAICWIWPGAYRGIGMQLSYACVAALMWQCERWAATFERYGLRSWLASLVATTLLCGLATAPILALRTGSAPLTGLAANIVAVPLAGAILVSGLPGIAAWAVGLSWLGHVLLVPAGWMAQLLEHTAQRAATWPLVSVENKVLSVGVPALVFVVLLITPRIRSTKYRRRFTQVVSCVCVAGAGWLFVASYAPQLGVTVPGAAERAVPRKPGELRMASLDVGQGDATLLASDAGAILVDVGPPGGDVVRRVRQLGVTRVAGVVLTHDSLDHRGSFEEVVARLHPKWVARPVHAPGAWHRILGTDPPKIVQLCAGSFINLGRDVRLDVRNPPCDGRVVQRTDDIHNDGAMVLEVHHRDVTMVIPADAEAPVLRHIGIAPADVLRVSHHGSSDPELPALLAQVRPAVAAISVGEGNSYQHPRASTLRALATAGVRTYRTDRDGTIVFDSDGARVQVQLVKRA